MPRSVAAPEKELRFTRSGQAPLFLVLAAMCLIAAVTLTVCGFYRHDVPEIPHPSWALLPLTFGLLSLRLAVHLTRHAYVILTPLGMEIFPFFRPAQGMRLVSWAEVHAVEANAAQTRLTLHHNAEKTAGIHLSLKPIQALRRPLLVRACAGRIPATTP